MIILSTNTGSANPNSIKKLANFVLLILSLANKKPDFLLLQEVGKSENDDESASLGYAKNVCSFDFKHSNKIRIDNDLRRSKSFMPSTSIAPENLQLLPDCLALIDEYQYTNKHSNRPRSMKILILNTYRNHKIKKTDFKNLIHEIIKIAESEFMVEGIIVSGDMNDTTISLNNLIELPHDGHHRHRPNSRLTNIDKIFLSRNLFDLGARVMVLPTCENLESDDLTLGHKTLVLFINENVNSARTFESICTVTLKAKIRDQFNDKYTEGILSKIKSQRKLALCPRLSGEHIKNNYDPAEEFIEILREVSLKSMKTITRTQPLQLHDLENKSEAKGPQTIKAFCKFYSTIKENLLLENELSNLNEIKKSRPTTKDLVKHLEGKLNRGHVAATDKINGFINSRSAPLVKFRPSTITNEDIKDNLSNINPTKTPWINGTSPYILIMALKTSNNALKIVKEIINSTLLMGKLFKSMTRDRVFFLFKNGETDVSSNYRPICIDNPLTKLACLLYNKLILKFVKKFMDPRNYSYTENKSTNTAIIKACSIVEKIRKRGNHAAIFATDCSGAFETIQASLIQGALDSQLDSSGKVKPLDWMSSYLREKELFAQDAEDNNNLIQVERNLKSVGSGQGSMISPKLWLIQSSASLYWLDQAKTEFLEKHKSLVIDFYLLAFADDNICILELEIRYELKIKAVYLFNMRALVDDFLEIWERILVDCGMILNQTKTEILLPKLTDNSRYPEFKSSIKWLGIHLKLDEDGFLVSDVDKNIQMIRKKTWSKFNEITLLTSSITVKLRVFTLYVESILNFCLIVILIAGSKFKQALYSFQVLQNQFLRRMTQTSTTSSTDEMHDTLQVHKIDYKLSRMAWSEWRKLDDKDSNYFEPQHKLAEKQKSPIDRLFELKNEFHKVHLNKKKNEFCINKYTTWKEKTDKKLLRVTKESRKAKEHFREIARLKKILEEKRY